MNEFEIIKSNLQYNPDTGVFNWRVPKQGRRKEVGYTDKGMWGYVQVRIEGKKYLAHRLAWLLYYGEFPDGILDHINGDKTDNRICNLRIASLSENQCNRHVQTNNTSTKVKGVRTLPNGRFSASITKDNKTYYLGSFDTITEAAESYEQAAIKLHKEFYRNK